MLVNIENKPRVSRKEINLIPLVNIIFLLLTFFIVAGTIDRVDPFALNLPTSSKKGDGKSQKANTIYINKDGKIAVNGDFVDRKDFYTIVNTLFFENKNMEVIIKSDAKVKSKDLIWVMKQIENIGSINVSIVTRVVNNDTP